MINLQKIKHVTDDYNYKYVYTATTESYDIQYKFKKVVNSVTINIYIVINVYSEITNGFILLETQKTVFNKDDISNLNSVYNMSSLELDEIISTLKQIQ